MTKRAAATEADLKRAMKAIREAGWPEAWIEYRDGSVRVWAGKSPSRDVANTCDELFG